MEYRNTIRRALTYLENRLKGEASIEEAAAEACYSVYHFSRVFFLMTGESPASYLRKRRLSEAAKAIAQGRRIIDVAMDFGFETQEGFTRAFKSEFGTTPGEYNRTNAKIALTESLLLRSDFLQGGTQMDYRMEKLGKTIVAGYPCFAGIEDGIFGKVWEMFNGRGDCRERFEKRGRLIGLEYYNEACMQSNKWFYMACSELDTLDEVPEDMAIKILPENDYAVFTHRGPLSGLPETFKRAYTDGLPLADLEPAGCYDFESYGKDFSHSDPDSIIEIWIPVRRKKG